MAESEREREDRELIEFLNELRVALPGVQVLFAFLLIVPFSPQFPSMGAGDRRVYFISVLCTAASAALLIAPSAHHRLRFRQRVKADILRVGNVLAVAGLALLATAMSCALYVVASVVYGTATARLSAAALGAGTALVWFLLPFLFRRPSGR